MEKGIDMEKDMKDGIVIIPDVHGRRFWQRAVELYPENDTIFLGDYVDPYPSEGISREETVKNLESIIEYAKDHRNVTLLLGNHDLHYLCNFGEACRYDYGNSAKICNLFLENLHLFRLATYREMDGKKVLFSHAPVLIDWIEAEGETTDVEQLTRDLNSILFDIGNNPEEAGRCLGYISDYRGGYDMFGSPVWADVREVTDDTIIPTAEYSIFGHTQLISEPIITPRYACLDCRKAFMLSPGLELKELS